VQEGEEEEHREEDAEVEEVDDVDKGETDGPGNSEKDGWGNANKAEPKSKSALTKAKLMDNRESQVSPLEDKQALLLKLLHLATQKLHAKKTKLIFTLLMVLVW
jgi:hypothetical protein